RCGPAARRLARQEQAQRTREAADHAAHRPHPQRARARAAGRQLHVPPAAGRLSLYGNMSFQVYGAGISINAWLSRMLGHKPGSVSTATSYTTVFITKKLNDVPLDVKDSSEFQAQLQTIDERFEQQRKQETLAKIQSAL